MGNSLKEVINHINVDRNPGFAQRMAIVVGLTQSMFLFNNDLTEREMLAEAVGLSAVLLVAGITENFKTKRERDN